MLSDNSKLIEAFEGEIRAQAKLRAASNTNPEKALLDAFKFYDLSGSATADRKAFFNVALLRFNINLFTEEQLETVWRHYAGSGALHYREFVAQLFAGAAPVEEQFEAPGDESHNDAFVRSIAANVIFKLRQRELASFLKLYREFALSAGDGPLALNHFTLALRRAGADVSAVDAARVYRALAPPNGELNYVRFFELLLVGHSLERVEVLRRVFSRFDFAGKARVNLSLLKELFNARGLPACRAGRLAPQEATAQFEELVDGYARLPKRSAVVDAEQFLELFSFLSLHIAEDRDFAAAFEQSFRYNELPRANCGATVGSDLCSVRPEHRVENIATQLERQLARRGNRGLILFFKALKGADFDSDGFIFFKEFCRAAKESRVELTEHQLRVLFEEFADSKQQLCFARLLERLAPAFDVGRAELTARLYERLRAVGGDSALAFHVLQSSFNPKGHPDFKATRRPDYEIREEFFDALQTFLTLVGASHLAITLKDFTRFFEFFARNWDADFLASVQTSVFRTRVDGAARAEPPSAERPAPRPRTGTLQELVSPAGEAAKPRPSPALSTAVSERPPSALSAAVSERPPLAKAPPATNDSRAQQALENHRRAQEQLSAPDGEQAKRAREKLLENARRSKKFAKLLEIEFEMTNKADSAGSITEEHFRGVLESAGVALGLTADELHHFFLAGCGGNARLHVQNFANELRGQMTSEQETAAVGLFNALCRGSPTAAIAVDRLRSALQAKKAAPRVFKAMSSTEVKEMWDYLIDLFVCLNLAPRKKNELELQDFLYFFDNFVFVPALLRDLIEFLSNHI